MSTKLPLDSNYDPEQQFILRMTDPVAAENLAADIEAGVSFKENFTFEFKPDMRHAVVRYNGQVYQGRLMDLPCIIESLKTTDKSCFYKTADICQMMICTQGEDNGPLRGTAAYLDNRAGSCSSTFDTSRDNREFQFLHGITPPLKNVLRRRFRKTRKKRFVDMPKIEKEVKQLLRADLQAEGVKWEVIWSDIPSTAAHPAQIEGPNASQSDQEPLKSSSAGNLAGTEDEDEDEEGTRAYAIDRRDVFGDISSSSVDSSDNSSEEDAQGTQEHHQIEEQSTTGPRTDLTDTNNPASTANSPTNLRDLASLGSLKHELAAELLLSDSGEDDVDDDLLDHKITGSEDHSGVHDDDLEDDLQTSVAAQLIAHATETANADDQNSTGDVDDVEDLDDDDVIVHRGGELLDDASLIGFADNGNSTDLTFSHVLDLDEQSH
ncbi:unnamed protein product [Calicophoron daubneyi]|uniref:TAFII55 protein conserved region domain-containing protein n=1 Tax=Calicophoron daubneyi TaxID=300641 RepID=A0AAV2TAN3_CALDB